VWRRNIRQICRKEAKMANNVSSVRDGHRLYKEVSITMAKYYDGCPRCGRRDFGEILHCKRCKTDFCTKCQGKRKLADGTEYGCCPRCGAEIDDDDTVVVVTTEKENARKS
jgi:hypothetical protein